MGSGYNNAVQIQTVFFIPKVELNSNFSTEERFARWDVAETEAVPDVRCFLRRWWYRFWRLLNDAPHTLHTLVLLPAASPDTMGRPSFTGCNWRLCIVVRCRRKPYFRQNVFWHSSQLNIMFRNRINLSDFDYLITTVRKYRKYRT